MASATEQDPQQQQEPVEVGASVNGEDVEAYPSEVMIELAVNLPQAPHKTIVVVSNQEQIHEIRQSLIDQPDAYQYTCFHLEHNGKRINNFITLSSIEGIENNYEVTLVQDSYTEKDARVHVIRVRDLLGQATVRLEASHGITPGISLLDDVDAAAGINFGDVLNRSTESGKSIAEDEIIDPKTYDFDYVAPPQDFILSGNKAAPSIIRNLALSSWNPPPHHLRQIGHLLYLTLNTIEGENIHITSHISGFWTNKSSNGRFDPSPRADHRKAFSHSLLDVIRSVSPGFEEAYKAFQTFQATNDPLVTFHCTNAIPSAPWLVPSPEEIEKKHTADLIRTQETYLLSGVDNTDSLRDWNEEVQSAKELPRETVPDRVFRERLLSKLYADYVEAATKGAIMVARGEITALNPTEVSDAQIFVHNNIFYSFGADGVGTFTTEGGHEAARVATGKDVAGVRLVNQLDIDGLYTAATVVIDYLGKRIVGQSIVPGIFRQRDPGENQIDYGGVEGKDIVAADERFKEPFAKLSKALKVKPHPVWDKGGKRWDLETSVETKGLVGTDARKYVLDLYRITPLDIYWVDNYGDYPHRMTVLRPELVDIYARMKMKEWADAKYKEFTEAEKDKKAAKEAEKPTGKTSEKTEKLKEPEEKAESKQKEEKSKEEETKEEKLESEPTARSQIDFSEFEFSLNPDVMSGQNPKTDDEIKQMDDDEDEVTAVCTYLVEKAIPNLVNELRQGETGFPMDGSSFGQLLHKRGINIRYTGKIAELASDEAALSALYVIAIQDMVTRSFKHVIRKYLANVPFVLVTACYAHLLNCLVGWRLTETPEADIAEEYRSLYPDANLEFAQVTTASLKAEIEAEVHSRFRYTLDSELWLKDLRPVPVLRDISLRLGLQLECKKYDFGLPEAVGFQSSGPTTTTISTTDGTTNISGGKKSKKKNKATKATEVVNGVKVLKVTFRASDIVNIVPIIKHSTPRSSLAEEAFEAGRISLLQGQRKLGQELLLESLSLHEQIYGILHPEVARVYNSLSTLYYQMDEKHISVELARKAIIVSERTIGVDSSETLLNYLNLSLFMHQLGRSDVALVYAKHALKLWNLIFGENHPDQITALNNAAVMLQQLKQYSESRRWFEHAYEVCVKATGDDSINVASLLFQLAQAQALDADSKAAVATMRKSANMFRAVCGAEDKNTKEAEAWLSRLTQNAVILAKQAKELAKSSISSSVKTVKASTAKQETSLGERPISDIVNYIEGNGSSGKKRKGKGARRA